MDVGDGGHLPNFSSVVHRTVELSAHSVHRLDPEKMLDGAKKFAFYHRLQVGDEKSKKAALKFKTGMLDILSSSLAHCVSAVRDFKTNLNVQGAEPDCVSAGCVSLEIAVTVAAMACISEKLLAVRYKTQKFSEDAATFRDTVSEADSMSKILAEHIGLIN
jgi:hypothetical protein